MRRIGTLLLVSLVGCGTAHGGIDRTADQTVRVVGSGGGQVRLTSSDVGRPVIVPFSIDSTWGALKTVYDSLAIPKDNLDDVQYVIGHTGVKAHRRLGTIPLVRIIDCGSTQGSPSADTYDVQISVLTQLRRGEGGTTNVTTQLEAVGRPMAFAGEYVRCTTKGVLETMLVDAVKARLAR